MLNVAACTVLQVNQSCRGAGEQIHIQPADVTLEAVEAVLFKVCDGVMHGMIKPGQKLVRQTIRCGTLQRCRHNVPWHCILTIPVEV